MTTTEKPQKEKRFYAFKRKNDDQATPENLFLELDQEFHFDYDPCKLNSQGLRESDGLGYWHGQRIFVNPPYSKPRPWIDVALRMRKQGKLVVMLLKSDTGTLWFHDLVLPNADEIRFLKGRVAFDGNKEGAPFPSLIAVFRPLIFSE